MLGSDPEVFLKGPDGYVSAIGLIGGTKSSPKPIKELGKGFCMQEDNVLLEFNTPPAKSGGKWVSNHTKILKYLNEYVKSKGLEISIDASAELPLEQLKDPRSRIFGCEPDFNVWTLKPNPRPYSDNEFLRSAGGHVHVEFKGTPSEKVMLGRRMDFFLGLWSVINDPDTRRRALYGKAGSIRFKPYGIEYRVLSNFWLKNEDLMGQVWDKTQLAIKHRWDVDPLARKAIDTGDVDLAMEVSRGI